MPRNLAIGSEEAELGTELNFGSNELEQGFEVAIGDLCVKPSTIKLQQTRAMTE